MNILIIHGPNMNLLGVQSAKTGERLTLDKLNRHIRKHVRGKDIELKIFQTHDIARCITLLQRYRNWADGVILAPMAWAKYEEVLRETIEILSPPVVCVYFDFGNISGKELQKSSILREVSESSTIGRIPDVYITTIDSIRK